MDGLHDHVTMAASCVLCVLTGLVDFKSGSIATAVRSRIGRRTHVRKAKQPANGHGRDGMLSAGRVVDAVAAGAFWSTAMRPLRWRIESALVPHAVTAVWNVAAQHSVIILDAMHGEDWEVGSRATHMKQAAEEGYYVINHDDCDDDDLADGDLSFDATFSAHLALERALHLSWACANEFDLLSPHGVRDGAASGESVFRGSNFHTLCGAVAKAVVWLIKEVSVFPCYHITEYYTIIILLLNDYFLKTVRPAMFVYFII